jgi:hypothetical protein
MRIKEYLTQFNRTIELFRFQTSPILALKFKCLYILAEAHKKRASNRKLFKSILKVLFIDH